MPQLELEKSRVWMLIQKNKHIYSFIGDIKAFYARIYNNLDSLVKTPKIPSVGSPIEAKPRNQVRKEVDEYLEQLRQIATKEDFQVNRKNMHNYIGDLVQVWTMLIMLQREVETGSKTLHLDAMEARVCFQPDTIT